MTNEMLAQRIATGEENLTVNLWAQIEKFVSWRASRFFYSYMDRCKALIIDTDDLYQVGYFAMLRAVEKFDAERGTKFITMFDFCLKTQFFRLAKMDHKGWEHNTVYACESLDEQISTAEGISLLDTIAAEDTELEAAEAESYWAIVLPALSNALTTLTDCQRKIITSVYYDGQTHEATAERYGIQRGSVNTIKRASLRKLRNNAELCAAYAC